MTADISHPDPAVTVTARARAEQANTAPSPVTRRPLSAAERMRRMRARQREAASAPLMFERADWHLFLDHSTLPQKAGCQPHELGRVVLKELVDNALDTGAAVTLERAPGGYVVADDGPGIDPADVPKLFAVSRPLLSSKLKRLPLRGMLGNGLRVVMGAVAALDGTISVASRGHRLMLSVDPVTGQTIVERDEPISAVPGTIVTITLSAFNGPEARPARESIAVAQNGTIYNGPSRPSWYGPKALRQLFVHVVPETATVAEVLREVFGIDRDDHRLARDLDQADVDALHEKLISATERPVDIGCIGPCDQLGDHYARVVGNAVIEGASIPYTIECWAWCVPAEGRGDGAAQIDLWINRSPSLARILGEADSDGITLQGCGLYRLVRGPKNGRYQLTVSVITPYLQLASDGKTPALAPFDQPIAATIKKAAGAAYRAMVRPPRAISIKDAAWAVMEDAYLKASGGGKLPANARQIMYAARPYILTRTGAEKLNDSYFTQVLLPDFIEANPALCADWDVVFDARGHFVEPHTGRVIALGTVEVRSYLGYRPHLGPTVALRSVQDYPTFGPESRFKNILFIEKEGFGPLLEAAQIAERYDVAIMSTKGMSTTAARFLLDRLVNCGIEKVLVLHDFDVAGFSIFGTLASDGRRYSYNNKVPLFDIGLRLRDVEAMGLQSEPVTLTDWAARRATLFRHGATREEAEFLRENRVELNAMTSRQFVGLLEATFAEHGVGKIIPAASVIEKHARRLIEQQLAYEALANIRPQLAAEAARTALPDGIEARLREHLARQPDLAWDQALAMLIWDRA